MDRRDFLKMLGLAPVAAVGASSALSLMEADRRSVIDPTKQQVHPVTKAERYFFEGVRRGDTWIPPRDTVAIDCQSTKGYALAGRRPDGRAVFDVEDGPANLWLTVYRRTS